MNCKTISHKLDNHQIKKIKKKQKINVKKPRVNKNHQREIETWFKQKKRPKTNYERIGENPLEKNSIQKT